MASSEKSEFDEDDGTQGTDNSIRVIKRKDSYTRRDNKTEGNWRRQSYESQCSSTSGNWRTTRHENRRSDVDGNWRTKRDEPKKDIQENWRSTRGHEDTSENFRLENAYSKSEVHGCWRLGTHKENESEDVWDAVEELHKELPHLFSVPPRKWGLERYSTEFINSFTSPSCSKEQIKEAADAIRKKVYFPFVMVYVEAPFERSKLPKYQHTPGNEFYELEKNVWKLALKEDFATEDSEIKLSSSQNSKEGDKSDMPGPPPKNNSFARVSSSNQVLLPSQVMDEDYLYFPSTEEAIGKMKGTIGGKWLVYGGFSMTKQDNMWSNLLPLCKEGVLIGIKASTAIITENQQYMVGEAILCYTADANDVNGVKKAGEAIRRAIGSKYILYYKTNAFSERGRYSKEGCHAVTSYMHTVKGTLYARDQYKRWTLIEL